MEERIEGTAGKEERPGMGEKEAIEVLKRYRDESGKSQSAIARELGVSAAAISSFLSGSYKAPHTLIPKIEALLSNAESKSLAPKAPGFALTGISKRVMDAIEYCHLQGKIGVIYGDAGIGKTMAIREYVRENPMSIYITISPAFATMSGVNDLLSEAVGVREKNSRRIYMELISRLKDSGRVIIIDEAQHLTKKTLEHLRSIADESGVGVCLVGNEEVYTRLKGSGKADFAQIFSRIARREPVFLSNVKRLDIEKIFFESHLDEETIDFLFKIAGTKYGIRGAVNVYVAAVALFDAVDAAAVVRVAKQMNIG